LLKTQLIVYIVGKSEYVNGIIERRGNVYDPDST